MAKVRRARTLLYLKDLLAQKDSGFQLFHLHAYQVNLDFKGFWRIHREMKEQPTWDILFH